MLFCPFKWELGMTSYRLFDTSYPEKYRVIIKSFYITIMSPPLHLAIRNTYYPRCLYKRTPDRFFFFPV